MANPPYLESTNTNIETNKKSAYGIKQQTNNIIKIQKNDVCTCVYRFFCVILQP